MQMSSAVNRWWRRRVQAIAQGREDGAVALIVAMMLGPVLIGCAAIGVDISSWYVTSHMMQKAADAAALAGVTHMPGDFVKATAVARDVAAKNGFPHGADNTVDVQTGNRPSQLRVTISTNVTNSFGSVLGRPTQDLRQTALADYQGPVPMGSPCNILGNEAMETSGTFKSPNCDNNVSKYWLSVAGRNMNKAQGDAFQSNWCTVPQAGSTIDGCSATGNGARNNNNEYNADGYFYTVRVRQAGSLKLEAYDMAYAATGFTCDALSATDSTNEFVTTRAEAQRRYARGTSSLGRDYCNGDNESTGSQGDGSAMTTTVIVRGQSPDAWNPKAGPIICTRTFRGYDADTNWTSALRGNSGSNYRDLRETFHRWTSITSTGPGCPGSTFSVTPGDYSIQVHNTNTGGGENTFALRAQLNGNSSASANVSIFAAGRVSLFNNISGTPRFHLVRLDSGAAGHVLSLNFFDLGDAASGSFNVRVLQPDSSNLNQNQVFSQCKFTGPRTTSGFNACQINGATANTYGGKWQTIDVQIPSNYTCSAPTDSSKCWVRIELTNASTPNDLTTWRADFNGDPVRIVE